jgi:hypothetical protein
VNLPRLLDSLIPIIVGGYLALGAFRIIRLSKNPKKEEEWHAKYGGIAKVLGILVVVYGFYVLITAFIR